MNEPSAKPRRGGTRVNADEIETTGGEKLLAIVLAVFIAIGSIWAYVKLDEVAEPSSDFFQPSASLIGPQDRDALRRQSAATDAVRAARVERRAATAQLELRREEYRTALDAGQPAGVLRDRYEDAQAGLSAAGQRFRAASELEARNEAPAQAAAERLRAARDRALDQAAADRDDHDRLVLGLRLALLVLMLAGSYRLQGSLRSRGSRYQPAAFAWIGSAAILAAVMAGDYTGDYIEFEQVGPLVISLAGIALTLAAFVALQRYLSRRTPLRRVRRGDCPFCGYPVRGNRHCEGCGREVLAECASCQQPRRVGTPRCATCGSA